MVKAASVKTNAQPPYTIETVCHSFLLEIANAQGIAENVRNEIKQTITASKRFTLSGFLSCKFMDVLGKVLGEVIG
jgi:hypothetical protein